MHACMHACIHIYMIHKYNIHDTQVQQTYMHARRSGGSTNYLEQKVSIGCVSINLKP